LKHKLLFVAQLIVLSLFFIAGCTSSHTSFFKSKNNSPETDSDLKLKEYINSYLANAFNIAFAENGVLYFTDQNDTSKIKKIRLDLYSEPEPFIDLSEWIRPFNQSKPKAEGLRVDQLGRILIAESGTGKLLRVTPDARKLEVLADSYDGYRFTTVKDLAIGQGDDLFVSSPFSGTVYRIRPKEGFIGILNEDLVRVQGICISPDGTRLVAAEPDASRVVVFDIPEKLIPVESWTLVDFSPTGVEPRGLAFDNKGLLYVGLGGKKEVHVFDLEKGKQILTFDSGDDSNVLRHFKKYLYVAGGKGVRRFPID
jgi:sugar lactone lactonase YvrE|tara:strand:+ start:616 stop:1548 length:933 start_codon:yes stop_codon:yes gene_type:complete